MRSSIPNFSENSTRNERLKSPKQFLDARVAADNAEGLWRIRDALYDLSNFAKNHPGGAEWINLTKGTDITEVFETHHLTTKAQSLLPKFYVRETTKPRSTPLTFKPDGFYRKFKTRAYEALKGVNFHKSAKKTDTIADLFAVTTFILALIAASTQSWLFIIATSVFLNWTTIIAHNYFHMRDNFRMYYFDLSGMSSKDWRISHVMSHHMYPNTTWDFELYSMEPAIIWALNHKDKTKLTILLSRIGSPFLWSSLFIGQGLRRYYSAIYEYHKFEFRDIVPFFLPLVMCLTSPSLSMAINVWLIILLIAGFFFGSIGFNAAHHHPDIFHDGDIPRKDLDWALLELDAVRDREIIDDSIFLVLTNFGSHGLHHLLPTVDHCYLPLCLPAFHETCEEFGIKPDKLTQWELLKGQFQQLGRVEPKENFRNRDKRD